MIITIHKEGRRIVFFSILTLALINIFLYVIASAGLFHFIFTLVSLLVIAFILRFFRKPLRTLPDNKDILYSPADGKIVAIEEVFEDEYFKTKKLQVSIFMSVWDVHINWFPAVSKVKYFRYHPGKYLVARHPKSSELNERTSIVVSTHNDSEILLRQIAGYVARRVISYAREGMEYRFGDELGFIRFGSRVDVFLPPGTQIFVKIGDKVSGLLSPLALLK